MTLRTRPEPIEHTVSVGDEESRRLDPDTARTRLPLRVAPTAERAADRAGLVRSRRAAAVVGIERCRIPPKRGPRRNGVCRGRGSRPWIRAAGRPAREGDDGHDTGRDQTGDQQGARPRQPPVSPPQRLSPGPLRHHVVSPHPSPLRADNGRASKPRALLREGPGGRFGPPVKLVRPRPAQQLADSDPFVPCWIVIEDSGGDQRRGHRPVAAPPQALHSSRPSPNVVRR